MTLTVRRLASNRLWTGGQRGQVIPLFGVMAVFLISSVALAVDFGMLANQHRNLQAFSDEATLAGVQQLNPTLTGNQLTTAQTAARKTAFIYLRDNLAGGNGAGVLPISTLTSGSYASCWGTAATVFTADIKGCQLPPPFANYNVTICTPGETSPTDTTCASQAGQQFNTLSVLVTESISTTLARLVGNSLATAGGFSEAEFSAANSTNGASGSQTAQLPFAIYSFGCLATGNKLEIVQGDVYINSCTLTYQSNGQAGFCDESSSQSAGNIVFGPQATIPTKPPPLNNATLSQCLASSAGQVSAMGLVSQPPVPATPPAFTPPPGYTDFDPNGTYSAAVASNQCVNNTVMADGSVGSDCFNPGYYTTVSGIANNLNPGVYYVTGDPGCNASTTTTSCAAIVFSGNTMNANWAQVQHMCWASPNVPDQGQFSAPCPDGFAIDPTASATTDPQCASATYNPPSPPTVSLAPAGNGKLDPGGTGTTYYVRVTALNGFGESTSNEQSIAINAGQGHRALTVAITAESGATGYNIYVSTASGTELLYSANVAAGSTSISGVGTGVAYPRFDTSSCKTGFRNIPKSPDASQNNGVTFVLFNKASVCFNQNCTSPGGSTPTVLLSPFCSTFRPGLPVTPPDQVLAQPAGIAAGTPCTPPYANAGAYMNDGAFIVYSTSQGIVQDQGINSRIGLAGTLYMPSMSLQIQQNAVFELVPGQIIAHDLNIQTGNKQNPSVYYPCCKANNSTAAPVLVGGQLPPVLHLIR